MPIRIGAHEVTVEEDLLITHSSSPWLLPEIVELFKLYEKTHARFGSVYIITVVGPGFNLPQDARKYVAEWGRSHTVTGNVVVGAPFAMRALIGFISRGAQLIGSRSPQVTFTATEAEARDWVAQQRRLGAG